jgi:glycosyltransferase involved in cell wall biosynthesis
VLDLHNIYSARARRAAQEQGFLKGVYLRREARLLERTERQACSAVSAILSVSELEAAHFTALGARRVYLVPNGVDTSAYASLPSGREGGPPVILYVGAMSWEPNAQAACFLARDTLPRLRANYPGVRLQIVGRDPTPAVMALNDLPGVEVTGTVPEILPFLRGAHLLAVPLEAGGGTRLKILEAFAAGLPVVSTPVGCEGLRVENNEHLVIAERERFAEGILSLLGNPELRARVVERSRSLVRETYDWEKIGETGCAAVQEAMRA